MYLFRQRILPHSMAGLNQQVRRDIAFEVAYCCCILLMHLVIHGNTSTWVMVGGVRCRVDPDCALPWRIHQCDCTGMKGFWSTLKIRHGIPAQRICHIRMVVWNNKSERWTLLRLGLMPVESLLMHIKPNTSYLGRVGGVKMLVVDQRLLHWPGSLPSLLAATGSKGSWTTWQKSLYLFRQRILPPSMVVFEPQVGRRDRCCG